MDEVGGVARWEAKGRMEAERGEGVGEGVGVVWENPSQEGEEELEEMPQM